MNGSLAAAISFLAVLVVGLWLVRGERGGELPAPADHLALAPQAEVERTAPSPESELDDLAPPAAAAGARESAPDPRADELAHAVWVEGQVLFPAGTPRDEQAFVEARGRKFADGSWQRARVAPDGRFRVPFAERSKTGWLALSARYCYLEPNFRWRKGDAASILLEPKLGGCIEGRVVPPPGPIDEVVGGRVQCWNENDGTLRELPGNAPEVVLKSDLVFTFAARLPGPVRLGYVGEGGWLDDVPVHVEAGVTSRIELELHRGATLRGRVLDGDGQPLAGARISASAGERPAFVMLGSSDLDLLGPHEAESAADGAFLLSGLRPPLVRLVGRMDGRPTIERRIEGLVDGETRDLELAFGSGPSLAGRVLWPDGRPARATVRVVPEGARASSDLRRQGRSSLAEAQTTEEGSFALHGLGPGPYTLHARAEVVEEIRPGHRATVAWKSTASGVAGGSSGLELVLGKGLELHGRVVDAGGAPLAQARVSLALGEFWDQDDVVFTAVESDGAFTVAGLRPGRWKLDATCPGHVDVRGLEIDVPANEPVLVTLVRGATLSGLVLDEREQPVEKASVAAHALDRGGGMGTSDARGAFSIQGLPAGPLSVSARAAGFAGSAPLELVLAAQEVRGDVVLRMRSAGRITGEVLDSDGGPLADLPIGVQQGEGERAEATSDSRGRFEIEGLLPGEVRVLARTPSGLQLAASATVVAGESAHVVLRVPELVVHLHGVVRVAGEPRAGASVRGRARDGELDAGACESDAEGRYALELPGPGSYWIGVGDPALRTHLWLALDVPRVAEMTRDFELTVGRVTGVVRLKDGGPLAGVRVSARQTSETIVESGWGTATSDERGAYELVLAPATYELTAGGDGGDTDPERSFANSSVPDVFVANGAMLRGIDFELEVGGTLEGVVRWGDGTPASRAELWIGPQGKVVESRSLGQADARGRFRIEGVAAGKHVVTATLGAGTAEWQKVTLAPGAVEHFELVLAASAWLEVRVHERGGQAVAADVEAFDEQQRAYGSVPKEGPLARLGPLPSGRYRVRARAGGRTVEGEVEITGREETKTLELVLE